MAAWRGGGVRRNRAGCEKACARREAGEVVAVTVKRLPLIMRSPNLHARMTGWSVQISGISFGPSRRVSLLIYIFVLVPLQVLLTNMYL